MAAVLTLEREVFADDTPGPPEYLTREFGNTTPTMRSSLSRTAAASSSAKASSSCCLPCWLNNLHMFSTSLASCGAETFRQEMQKGDMP